jgi:hypothetical protein
MAKKSLYLFLTGLLGMLLFAIVCQVVFFIYIYMLGSGVVVASMNYGQIFGGEYFILIIMLLLGAWYGIWLGLYWFEKVYEQRSHKGFVHHLATNYFPGARPKTPESKMAEVRERLEENLWQLEDLAQSPPIYQPSVSPEPIKRRAVRKKAPKKLNALQNK